MDELERYNNRMIQPPFFFDLRVSPWYPKFYETSYLSDVSIAINSPHEDFPDRVVSTANSIRHLVSFFKKNPEHKISNEIIKQIHYYVFPNLGGDFRQINVSVGQHHPPKHELVYNLMNQLEKFYSQSDMTIWTNMLHWYSDFETIHPFIDGNGRTGGYYCSYSFIYTFGLFYGTMSVKNNWLNIYAFLYSKHRVLVHHKIILNLKITCTCRLLIESKG